MATNLEAMTAGTPTIVAGKCRKQFQALFDVIEVQVALTEASVAAQVGSVASITVPGVELGDYVMVSYPADLAGLLIQAVPSAADTIKVKVFNMEGTDAVTAMSGGLVANLLVLKPKFGQ